MTVNLEKISSPSLEGSYTNIDNVNLGPYILPEYRISLYSPDEWEIFIKEFAHILKQKNIYNDVCRFGGAGDQGVDVCGFNTEKLFDGEWDAFQCKHYSNPLNFSDGCIEIAKLIHYTFSKAYTLPNNYFFVSPKGLGTKFLKLIKNPSKLKEEVIKNWDANCKKKVSKMFDVELTQELRDYINSIDFCIFKEKGLLDVIDIYKSSPFFSLRFGGGLPKRPLTEEPSAEISENEFKIAYIKNLLEVYAEYLNIPKCNITDLEANQDLKNHLKKSRIQFYSAEALKNFSRDCLPEGEYERLKDEFFVVLEDIVLREHKNGFEKVKSTIQEAYKIQIDSHPLKERMIQNDRAGICHQLSNDGRIKWI